MEYGFMMLLSQRETIDRFAGLALLAEKLGFSMAWLGDSQLIAKDAPVALTLAAAATERIGIGSGVTNPVTRHFATIANFFAALTEASDGRAVCGIGSGDSAVRTLGLKTAKLSELRESVERIRSLSEGGEVHIAGVPIRMLTGGKPFPIFIAATQRKMLQLAGAIADGVIVMGGADREITEWQLARVEEGAQSAGRSLDDLFIDLWFAASISENEDRARDDVRPWASSQARFFAKWNDLPNSLKPFEADFAKSAEQYDFFEHLSRHARHKVVVSDAFVDVVAVSGPVEKCAEKIRPLLDLKIDRVTFALLPGGREQRLRVFGEELGPLLEGGNKAGSQKRDASA